MDRVLVADIGGTNTRVALFEKRSCLRKKRYASRSYSGLLPILKDFLAQDEKSPQLGCFGVAGPIKGGKCHTTNLPWIVDSEILRKELSMSSLWLLNDLEASAYAIPSLSSHQLSPLNEKAKIQKGNVALISAGTGLGEAGLLWDGAAYHPFASEGGHCDFAPKNELEMTLFSYLHTIYGHVSYERIVSGPGFRTLLDFFLHKELGRKPPWFYEIENRPEQAPKIISEKGVNKECILCVQILDLFCSVYGAEAGNVALKWMALGGVYLGGGIAPKILFALKEGGFFRAFINKGRFADLLSSIPIYVILEEDSVLYGALEYIKNKIK